MGIERLNEALAGSADPGRAAAQLAALRDAVDPALWDGISPEAGPLLAAMLAGSQWLPALLVQHPDWMTVFQDVEALCHPRRKEGLRREVETGSAAVLAQGDEAGALDRLHAFRLRELLRIAIRDLGRLGALPELLEELSNVADLFLEGVLRVVWRQQSTRFGEPWHQDARQRWQRTPFAVLGLGKLGAQELNYSSDVDLLFVYGEEGFTFRAPPAQRRQATGQVLANHQFFKRLCEALIREATRRGPEGGGLRVDMRLRPEGDAGPLSRSLESYENFYAEWGQTWERMMLLKARGVAGDTSLAGEFLEIIQPFRYPRSLGEGLLGEMAAMKARIEREVVRPGELERNVKLGRGGIREIEFVAQSLQVLHAGRNPFLQNPQTLAALPKLDGYGLLPSGEVRQLIDAYVFLREVEHRLQMEDQRQTHTLPENPTALERIARQMGFPNRTEFGIARQRHAENVRAVYDHVLGRPDEPREDDPLPPGFEPALTADWLALLSAHGFRDPERALRLSKAFVEGPGFGHISRRTTELGRQLMIRVLDLCPNSRMSAEGGSNGFMLSDPDRVMARLDSYVANYGTRAALYELWTTRPMVFEHILKLFDRSEFLAELAIREPDLVDELEIGAHLGRQKDARQTLGDLRHGRGDADQHLWLRRYFQTEFMRLGLRDILGYVDFEEANCELSALAEACVEYALEVVARRHRMRKAPFAVIGLGKFGGGELVYGSDLDVIFVAPEDTPDLPGLQRLAGEMLDLLSTRTAQGSVFALDMRLRPDGEKGLLVNGLKAHEAYYRQRAMLWEIQALTRARHIGGHRVTGTAFERLARRLTNFRESPEPLVAFQPEWKSQIAAMRLRIEKERTPKGKDSLAFKTGAGGLVDVEFLAQILAMAHGWYEPNTSRSLERARDCGALATGAAETLITNFRHLRRMESILRRWSFEGEAVLPDDAPAQYRVAVRCGYSEAESFFQDVARWRQEIRRIYSEYLPRA